MKLPEKYSFLKLLSKQEQIIILELFTKKNVRTNRLYKMGIIKSYKTLYKFLDNLLDRDIVKKINHNKSNITYELTPKGLNLAYIIASNEKRFNTYCKDVIFIINVGRNIPDLLKKYYEYRIDVNGFR
jgi:DNA-binding HxlR family transcriptional regulator